MSLAIKTIDSLLNKYINDYKNKDNEYKLLDEIAICINGFALLLNENDKNTLISIINKYNLGDELMKSVTRIRNNSSLAFT